MRSTFIFMSLAIWTISVTASADPLKLSQPTQGYTYFNRVGSVADDQGSDLLSCQEAARHLSLAGSDLYEPGIASLLINGGPAQAVIISGIENCMVVKGWRVVRLPEEEGASVAQRSPPEVLARISPWIGAEVPNGEIVRSWGNEAANGSTDRFEVRPHATRRGALSLLAFSETLAQAGGADASQSSARATRPVWLFHNLSPARFSSAPSDQAIVVFRMRGLSARAGNEFSWARLGPNAETYPSTLDHATDIVTANISILAARAEGNWRAYVVPAGRWRLESIGLLSLCLGSPSFEVRPGEVVYAGSFDFSAEHIGPDLSLEPVRAWLSGQPSAQTVRAAEYSNGWIGQCGRGRASMYAMEIAGMPFREGYLDGGARTH